jgi:hypothetical protein
MFDWRHAKRYKQLSNDAPWEDYSAPIASQSYFCKLSKPRPHVRSCPSVFLASYWSAGSRDFVSRHVCMSLLPIGWKDLQIVRSVEETSLRNTRSKPIKLYHGLILLHL